MNSFWKDIPALMPEYGITTIGLTLFFLLTGWLTSISISMKHNWIALLAFIPITNPIAIIILITKKAPYTLVPVVFYGLALVVWFNGSRLSNQIEQNRLAAMKDKLSANGDPITGLAYKKTIIDPELNVWYHPFLSAFIEAGQQSISEIHTNKIALPTRKKFKFPDGPGNVRYDRTEPGHLPFVEPFRRLNEHALESILETSEGNPTTIKLPNTPEASATILEETMDSIEKDLAELNEAVFRPDTHLPRIWEGGMNMLLPELSELKRFSQVVSLHSIYHVIRGDQETAFEDAKLGFRLAQIVNSDILISRLVQIAQLIYTLEAINAAQTYHAWTDTQWQELESKLHMFDFIALMPASIRCERALGFDTMEPMLSNSDPIDEWEHFLEPAHHTKQQSTWLHPMKQIFFLHISRAFFAKNWRLCLQGYSKLIEDLDHINTQSRITPWKRLLDERNKKEVPLKKVGLFGHILLPSLEGLHKKAMEAQIRIIIVTTSIALERHFLKYQSYPTTLQALKTEFPQVSVKDPITNTPLKYKRTNDGYKIYSVGLNGKDENGMRHRTYRSSQEQPADDLLWIVGESTKLLPPITINPKPPTDSAMDIEMMQRYGLIPMDSEKKSKNPNGKEE